MEKYKIVQLDALPPIPCPCGEARRGFWNELMQDSADTSGVAGNSDEGPEGGRTPGRGTRPTESPASVHLTHIRKDAAAHYHKKTTEIYVVLSGGGLIELDGKTHEVKPLTAVMIPPGTVHRAVGEMDILNIAIPPFDAADEYLV